MGGEVREDHSIVDSQGNVQHQSVVRRGTLLSKEDPSTLKFVIDNTDYIDSITRRLTGYNMVFDEHIGDYKWEHTGMSLINDKGKAWLSAHLHSMTDKMVQLSNYPLWRVDTIKKAEAKRLAASIAVNRVEFGIRNAADACDVLLYTLRAMEAAYGRALNDRGARHFFGSLDEGVNITPRNDRKLFGVIPY